MDYRPIITDGSLTIVLPPCIAVANGGLFITTEKRYTLPATVDGVLAVSFNGNDITVFTDMYPTNLVAQHPDYVYLGYVVTRNGILVSYIPLAGPMPQTMTQSGQTWMSVTGQQTANIPVGGTTAVDNTLNGWVVNMGGAGVLDVTLSKRVSPGFSVRFISTTASGFRLLTDSALPIMCKVTPTVTGIGGTAWALCIGKSGIDAQWFAAIT